MSGLQPLAAAGGVAAARPSLALKPPSENSEVA